MVQFSGVGSRGSGQGQHGIALASMLGAKLCLDVRTVGRKGYGRGFSSEVLAEERIEAAEMSYVARVYCVKRLFLGFRNRICTRNAFCR